MLVKRRVAHLVIVAACICGFTQTAGTAGVGPQIVISLPDNIPPEVVWVRYTLYGPEGSGGRISRGEKLKAESSSRHYYISALFAGAPAQHAKVVIYAPGCRFATYELDLGTGSDITEQFQCAPLPTKTVHGFLHPNEIPTKTYLPEKKLDIAAYLDGNWVCHFFLQQRHESNIIEAGSCLGSDVPLGTVGQLDPARGGTFEITIPDFTRDPVFGQFATHGNFGVIELVLQEKKIGHGLATIKTDDSPELGLNVQGEYPDPVIFSTVHH